MNYYLYNILTNTLFKLTSNLNNLINMIEYLINQKYKKMEKENNTKFIKNLLK